MVEKKKLLLVSVTVRGKQMSRFIYSYGSVVDVYKVFPELLQFPRGTTFSIG